MAIPAVPATFTKFPASLAGPFDDVELAGRRPSTGRSSSSSSSAPAPTAWPRPTAWSHVAGLTVGQDISERTVQFAAGSQFSLGKSYRGLRSDGPVAGHARRARTIPTTSRSAARSTASPCRTPARATSSSACRGSSPSCPPSSPLLPGDVIFTGTPAGVGSPRKPPRFLQAGETLESWIEGIGTIRNRFVPRPG